VWRLLEPSYRRWAPFYGGALVVGPLAALGVGGSRGYTPSISVLVGLGVTLAALWGLQATRRTLDRREGRDALFFKLPVTFDTIAWLRPLDSALPYLAATLLAMALFLLTEERPPHLTAWHVATLGLAVAAIDQLLLALEESQIWLTRRGAGRLAMLIQIALGVLAGAGGVVFGDFGTDWLRGKILAPWPWFGLALTVALLIVTASLAAFSRWVFLRRDHPGTTGCL
jgi:hypothetical protein